MATNLWRAEASCQEPSVWERANFLQSLAELSAGSPGFKPSSTRKQAAFHGPTLNHWAISISFKNGFKKDLFVCLFVCLWDGSPWPCFCPLASATWVLGLQARTTMIGGIQY